MSEVLGTVLLTAVTIAIVAGFGLTVYAALSDTAVPPTAAFSLSADVGVRSVNVTVVGGSSFASNGADFILALNGSQVTGALTIDAQTTPGRFGPGDVLRIELAPAAPTPGFGTTLTFYAVDRESNSFIGTATRTLIPASGLPAFSGNVLSLANATIEPAPVLMDGRSLANISVNVTSSFGLAFLERVSIDLTPLGGRSDVPLLDDGQGVDTEGGDGMFVARFIAERYTFDAVPSVIEETLTLTARDILGNTLTSTVSVYLKAPAQSKVAQGVTYRPITESARIGNFNLTNITLKSNALLDNDQIEVRVTDLDDSTKSWTALVSFSTTSCGGSPGVTSVTLTRDGVAGSATFTPASGCMTLDADTRIDMSDPRQSRDADNATVTWSVTGDATTVLYASAGISTSNEAVITYLGDTVSGTPAQLGIAQADLTWRAAGSAVAGVPSAPVLAATAGTAQASLSWSSPPNGGAPITAFNIYRGTTSGSLALIDTTGANTSYVSAGLTNGVTYYYQVAAVNGVGEGPRSNEVNATPATTPGAPQNLVATAGDRQVSLGWNSPAGNGGSAVTNYRIYGGTTSGALVLIDTVGTNTSYIAAGLTNGITYYFQVSAVNAVGEGPRAAETPSTPISAATAPTAPQNTAATATPTQVELSWNAPASNGGSAITGYRIYRGTTSGSLTLLDSIGTNTTYTAAGLTNGVTYYYQITAVNAIGEGPRGSEVSATPITTPSAPQALSATAGNAQATLAWSAPSSTGGSSITSYRIYRGTTSGSLTLLDTVGTNTSYVSAGLTNGVTYHYAVSAVNAAGEGPRAAEVSAVPITVPSAPQTLSVTAGNGFVSLSWSAPTANGGAAVTNYRIYRGTTSGSLTLLSTIGTNTSYVSAGLTNGVTYYYQISAVNSAGEGTRSGEAAATPTAPNASPTASITPSVASGLAPVIVTYTLTAADSDGTIANWTLQYGDGTGETGSGTPPTSRSKTYTAFGTYLANYSVTDNLGASVRVTTTVRVSAYTYVNTAPTDLNGGTITNIANLARDNGGDIATLSEDAASATQVQPSVANDRTFNTSTPITWVVADDSGGGSMTAVHSTSEGVGSPVGAFGAEKTGTPAGVGRLSYSFTKGATSVSGAQLSFYYMFTPSSTTDKYVEMWLVKPGGAAVQIGTRQAYAASMTQVTAAVGSADLAAAGTYTLELRFGISGNKARVLFDEIHLTWTDGLNYRFAKQFSIPNVPTEAGATLTFEIRYRTATAAEGLQLWTEGPSTTWTQRTTLSSGTLTTFNRTVTASEIVNGAVNLRLIDATQSGDTTQSTWEIDYIRVRSVPP